VTNDCNVRCRDGVPSGQRPSFADLGMPWGVEELSMRARFAKAVNAGVDQFGGTERADTLVAAVRAGELAEARLDTAVRRIMAQKLALGIFENPYVDPDVAARTVGSESFRAAGLDAQRRALVLLENRDRILPLDTSARKDRLRVYLHGISPEAAAREGWSVVDNPALADVGIVRLNAPYETLFPGYIFGSMQHDGSLAFRDGDRDFEAFKRVSGMVPTIVTVYLDRPAILTPLKERARAVIANFGVSDAALFDVLTGRAKPQGKLPFELPSSMAAVLAQRADVPHDSAGPLYPIWFGRSY
jgi:beta-glucosidase